MTINLKLVSTHILAAPAVSQCLKQTAMKLSVEILDHIFSFLVLHPTLIDCSEDPVLSPIVDRYIYYEISVWFGKRTNYNWTYSLGHLYQLLYENPHILSYVRVLRIRVLLEHFPDDDDLGVKQDLDRFAKTLLKFPILECIVLNTSKKRLFCWPTVFRAALEDRLCLPTLKELHIVGNQELPCPLIDNHKNIEKLLLSGSFTSADDARVCNSTLPQLQSLTLLGPDSLLLTVLKPHIKALESLKCNNFCVDNLSKLLEVCLQTLNELDIDFDHTLCKF